MNAILLILGNLGFQEILLIGIIVLIFFGSKKIPEFMKGLGRGVREFKDSMNNVKRDLEESDENPPSKKKIEDPK